MTESASAGSPTPDAEHGVGLVVVSHSRALARAAVALAAEMLHGRPVRIEVAAGLDDTTFGTDAVAIIEAIERADGPAGVVVLMDLGSAVLSAELALDLLDDPSIRDRVILSPAPLVEGLIVAAVAAAGGAEPGRGRRRGARRAAGQVRVTWSTPLGGATARAGRCRRGGGGRRLLGREPPRPARPARRPPGQRGARARCIGPAPQPHHRAGRRCPQGASAGSRRWPRCAATRSRSEHPDPRPRRRSSTCSPSPRAGSTRPSTRPPSPQPRPGPQSVGGPLAGLARDRHRPGSTADRGPRRPRPGTGGGSQPPNGAASWRRGRRTTRHRARPGRHRPRGGCGSRPHLRRPPVAADRRRDARRRQGPHRHRHRRGLRLGRVPRRRRARVGGSARLLPAGTGRRRPGGCRAGAARADRRARAADDGAGNPRGQRPDPGRDRRPRPRPGDRRRARSREPELARRDPGPGPGHPGRRRGRSRACSACPRAPRRSSTAAVGELLVDPGAGLVEDYERRAADAAAERARQLASPNSRPSPATESRSPWPPTSDR